MNNEFKRRVNLDPLEQCEGRYSMEDDNLLSKGCLKIAIIGIVLLGIIILFTGLQVFEIL